MAKREHSTIADNDGGDDDDGYASDANDNGNNDCNATRSATVVNNELSASSMSDSVARSKKIKTNKRKTLKSFEWVEETNINKELHYLVVLYCRLCTVDGCACIRHFRPVDAVLSVISRMFMVVRASWGHLALDLWWPQKFFVVKQTRLN